MVSSMALLVPVLLPAIVYKVVGDNDTDPNVIVKYYPHAEANYPTNVVYHPNSVDTPATVTGETEVTPTVVSTTTTKPFVTHSTPELNPEPPEVTDGVVFIPNEAPARVEDQYDSGGVKLQDLFDRKTIQDLMPAQDKVETETPQNEVIFIPGTNEERTEKTRLKEEQSRRSNAEEKRPEKKLDCKHLECHNTIKSICGGKIVNQKMQYRSFMNECYFRKVNCNFKYEFNRYTIVSPENCQKKGPQDRPFSFRRKNFDDHKKIQKVNVKMSYSSRRSLSMSMNGSFCSHPCPVSCPEDYEPECALSATGQRRVFMNHCKLDDNSCLFGVVWHKRPLSECVGGQMADLRQNRRFIDWMQRIGIIDKKGKLVLE